MGSFQSLSAVQIFAESIKKDEEKLIELEKQKDNLISEIEKRNEFKDSIKKEDNKKSTFLLKANLNSIESRIMRKTKNLEENEKLLRVMREKNSSISNNNSGSSTTNLLVAVGITRFGVLAITIYLVQILINLYKNNVKVVSSYRAYVDTLMLLDHSHKKIGDMVEKISPNIDFGSQPNSFPEKVYEGFDKIAETAFSKVKSGEKTT